jgi:hypothetical protein
MTHEHTAGAEADDGPEHDSALPAADSIPVADTPDELDPVTHPDEWDD